MSLPVFQTFPLTTAAGAEIQGLDLSPTFRRYNEKASKYLAPTWGAFFQKPKSRPRTTSKGCKSFRGNNALPPIERP